MHGIIPPQDHNYINRKFARHSKINNKHLIMQTQKNMSI